jgi:hypothetical protein
MARVSLILGESASGKSRSVKNLPPKNKFVVNVVGKELPFPGSETKYPDFNTETGQGNLLVTKSTRTIAKVLKYVSENRPEIKAIVIDDNQYLSLFTYTSRIDEKDWAKFNTIAVNMVDLVEFCKTLRKDIMIFILQHVESGTDASGNDQIQAKTLGKFVKEKVTYEGLFTIVLLCDKEEGENDEVKHFFWTRKARSTVKTPEGMFTEQKIPNDLFLVAKAISSYYN